MHHIWRRYIKKLVNVDSMSYYGHGSDHGFSDMWKNVRSVAMYRQCSRSSAWQVHKHFKSVRILHWSVRTVYYTCVFMQVREGYTLGTLISLCFIIIWLLWQKCNKIRSLVYFCASIFFLIEKVRNMFCFIFFFRNSWHPSMGW